MEHAAHVAAVDRESLAMAAALTVVEPDAPVPSCPGWTAHDLAVHAGLFAGFWAHVLCEGTGRPKVEVPDPPTDGIADWFAGVTGDLSRLTDEIDPATAVWTWYPRDRTAGFIVRRAAHELAVHRVDAELAGGTQSPVEAALAADGIDEILVIVDRWQIEGDRAGYGDGERLHLRAVDVDRDWRLVLAPGGMEVVDGGPADLRVEAAASDLEMLLYGRPALGSVVRTGDEAVLAAWTRVFTFT